MDRNDIEEIILGLADIVQETDIYVQKIKD